ncbi:hypothetical protein EYD45_06945 [Hyunsoonleella flava]|uniref:DUF4136 domain-containing protein n=1 Tax=Hyunsoonleella flava TaxID=2527939 RepID=A0A4Q9FK01_9FLAO|nr:hypothetical protein [Hyunsoonleella flava]TBN04349.1 hypothetical protein EYD45_06945 [Hyunsoonleella flava]
MKKFYSDINLTPKSLCTLYFALLLVGCSSTKLISSWKNPEHDKHNLKKVLVIGVTPNFEARKAYELQIALELNARKINALQSAVVFESSFRDSQQTEKDIEAEVNKLISSGYDTVLVSLVKGVEDNRSHTSESSKVDYRLRNFIGYYFKNQQAKFNQEYYTSYKVFHIETSIYNLKSSSNKSLIWRSLIDLIDPKNDAKAIDIYSKKIIKILERDEIIPKKAK